MWPTTNTRISWHVSHSSKPKKNILNIFNSLSLNQKKNKKSDRESCGHRRFRRKDLSLVFFGRKGTNSKDSPLARTWSQNSTFHQRWVVSTFGGRRGRFGDLATSNWRETVPIDLFFSQRSGFFFSASNIFFFDCFDRFLPRLGAPITYVSISSDAKYYGLLFDDNTVKIVNAATLKVEKALVQAIKKGKFDWNVHFFDTFDTFDTFI